MSGVALSISNLCSKPSQLAPQESLPWSPWRPWLKTKAQQQFCVFGFLCLLCRCLVCRTSPGFLPAVFQVGEPFFPAQGWDSWQVFKKETSRIHNIHLAEKTIAVQGHRWGGTGAVVYLSNPSCCSEILDTMLSTKSTLSHWPNYLSASPPPIQIRVANLMKNDFFFLFCRLGGSEHKALITKPQL